MNTITKTIAMITLSLAVSSVSATGFEIEPNNTTGTAMVIDPGTIVQGNISAASDLDTFKITAKTTGLMRVVYRHTPDNYVYNIAALRVLNSAGIQVAGANAYAPDPFTIVEFGVTAGASYFIELSGCQTGTQCSFNRSKIYDLVAVNTAWPVYEAEPNNELATATPVEPNAQVYGQHNAKTDLDYFKIDLPMAGEFSVQVSRPTDSYVYSLGNLAILDAAGQVLGADEIYAPQGQAKVVLGTKAPTTLYVRATSCATGTQCDVHFGDQYLVLTSFHPILSRLINLSTRDYVGTGENVMIAGFVIEGPSPHKVLIRAIGPSMNAAGVVGTLDNPTLRLTTVTGQFITDNDDWEAGPNALEIQNMGRAPTDPRESALLVTLNPNTPYTAIVEGAGGTTGVALVEVYEVE